MWVLLITRVEWVSEKHPVITTFASKADAMRNMDSYLKGYTQHEEYPERHHFPTDTAYFTDLHRFRQTITQEIKKIKDELDQYGQYQISDSGARLWLCSVDSR